MFRERANAVRRKEFVFVEQDGQHALEAFGIDQREDAPRAAAPLLGFDVLPQFGCVLDEPKHAFVEAFVLVEQFGFERFDGKERNQPDQRTNAHREM